MITEFKLFEDIKMPKFKVGDRVIIKKNMPNSGFKIGEKYRIASVSKNGRGEITFIALRTLDTYWPGNPPSIEKGRLCYGSWYIGNFELDTDRAKKYRRQEQLKLIRKQDSMRYIDPYGEEDWSNESKIYENKEYNDFSIGDKIVCDNPFDYDKRLYMKKGTIIDIFPGGYYMVEWEDQIDDPNFPMYSGNRVGRRKMKPGYCWAVYPENIDLLPEEKEKKKEKRKKWILDHPEDIYGEEDWSDDNESKVYK